MYFFQWKCTSEYQMFKFLWCGTTGVKLSISHNLRGLYGISSGLFTPCQETETKEPKGKCPLPKKEIRKCQPNFNINHLSDNNCWQSKKKKANRRRRRKMGVSVVVGMDSLSDRAATMREALQKSQTITDNVVSILGSFDSRLSALETAMRPTQVAFPAFSPPKILPQLRSGNSSYAFSAVLTYFYRLELML